MGAADRGAWEQVRGLLLEAVGESTFEIWLQPVELIAVDRDGTLIVSAPEATVIWVRDRFGRLLDRAAQRAGRRLRFADTVEGKAAATLPMIAVSASGAPVVSSAGAGSAGHVSSDVAGGSVNPSAAASGDRRCDFRADQSSDRPPYAPAYRSAYPSSYTDVYNQAKEVS